MKKYILIFIFLTTPLFPVHAQSAATSTLNAGFLSDVWYSSTAPLEGDTVKIFGGIYNSSALSISGTALYYIDGKQASQVSFVSLPNTLTQVSTPWVAVSGDHKIQIKAVTTQTLAQAESSEGTISVAQRPTKADIQKDTQNIIQKTTEVVDPYANKIANNLSEVGNSLSDTAQKKVSDVLGKNASSPQVASAVAAINPVIQWIFDGAAFLVRHWAWSLLGLVVIYFIWRKSRKKNSWW